MKTIITIINFIGKHKKLSITLLIIIAVFAYGEFRYRAGQKSIKETISVASFPIPHPVTEKVTGIPAVVEQREEQEQPKPKIIYITKEPEKIVEKTVAEIMPDEQDNRVAITRYDYDHQGLQFYQDLKYHYLTQSFDVETTVTGIPKITVTKEIPLPDWQFSSQMCFYTQKNRSLILGVISPIVARYKRLIFAPSVGIDSDLVFWYGLGFGVRW